jgi:hypothetical protein
MNPTEKNSEISILTANGETKIQSIPKEVDLIVKVNDIRWDDTLEKVLVFFNKTYIDNHSFDHIKFDDYDILKLNIDVDGMHKGLFVKFYDDINDYFKYIGISEKVKTDDSSVDVLLRDELI